MHVLSLTSHVCYGHVGGQAMTLPLQRLGHDLSLVPTVLLSNHPAHGQAGGGPVKLVRLRDIVDNLLDQGFADDCAALHCGYLGQSGVDEIVLDALAHIRRSNPDAIFICDPVMGDDGRVYVEAGLVERIRERLVPAADIVTPNKFELELLCGGPTTTGDEIRSACRKIIASGPSKVVCTSALRDGPDLLVFGAEEDESFTVRMPYLDNAPFGTGDAFCAILLGHLLNGRAFRDACARACASVHGLIRASIATGAAELDIVGAQLEVVEPSEKFVIE